MKNNIAVVTTSLALLLLLTACSSEPSASDIDQTFRAEYEKSSKRTQIHEIRKIGCAAAQGAVGYMCDVEIDISSPSPWNGQLNRNKTTVKLRFYKDEGKWKVSPN
ncbi:MAG: hypothetical protein HOO97_00125 [Sideroxydans sp.]|nr:hypothetical protein [Sideroxydans sp.]NOT97491.1 hypothetical protein [Sideroxydans sp.]